MDERTAVLEATRGELRVAPQKNLNVRTHGHDLPARLSRVFEGGACQRRGVPLAAQFGRHESMDKVRAAAVQFVREMRAIGRLECPARVVMGDRDRGRAHGREGRSFVR